jgi:hypothetical protein
MVWSRGEIKKLFRFFGMPNPVPGSLAAQNRPGPHGRVRYPRKRREEGPSETIASTLVQGKMSSHSVTRTSFSLGLPPHVGQLVQIEAIIRHRRLWLFRATDNAKFEMGMP